MASRCDHCGVDEYMPYVCKFCKGKYCAAHRLPENHGCAGLVAHREQLRAQGRVFAPEQESPITPRVSSAARAGAATDSFWKLVDGKMSYVLMGVCLAVFVLEFVVAGIWGGEVWNAIFPLQRDFLTQPWTIVTSIFSHDPRVFSHIMFNMLALLFFGNAVEKLIGTRRFTGLFLASGAIAGLAQILLGLVLYPNSLQSVLGASGALQGIMGTLVILAPTLTVLVFFVIPAPLWALTALFVVYDLMFNVFQQSGFAGIAHLTGLAVGIYYGLRLKRRGMRVVRSPPPPMQRF